MSRTSRRRTPTTSRRLPIGADQRAARNDESRLVRSWIVVHDPSPYRGDRSPARRMSASATPLGDETHGPPIDLGHAHERPSWGSSREKPTPTETLQDLAAQHVSTVAGRRGSRCGPGGASAQGRHACRRRAERHRPISRQIEAAVYFCTLEALNDVAKYAEASSVKVGLADEGGQLQFRIVDDARYTYDPIVGIRR